MKLIIDSNSNIVTAKMRDEMYLKHLRQVEKITNRENDNLTNDINQYRSISALHLKNKVFARGWQHNET
jgi:hypothetical protein